MSKSSSFTALPAGSSWDDDGLLAAFNSDFGLTVSDKTVLRKLLGTVPVRPWYAQYKQARADALQLPNDWKGVGLTEAQWKSYQAIAAQRASARRSAADATNRAVNTYRAAVASIEATRDAELARTDSPLVQAIELGYEDLPLAALVAVETETDPIKRDAVLKKELDNLRRAAIAALPQP